MNHHPLASIKSASPVDGDATRSLEQVEVMESRIRDALRSEDAEQVTSLIQTTKAFVKTATTIRQEVEAKARSIETEALVASHLEKIAGRLALVTDRAERGIELLNDRLKQIAILDQPKKLVYEQAIAARDAMALEFREKYPALLEELADLLERAVNVQRQVTAANRNRPSKLPLIEGVERSAGSDRGPDEGSILANTILKSLTRLPKRDAPYTRFDGRYLEL